jgi:hypothetical protein
MRKALAFAAERTTPTAVTWWFAPLGGFLAACLLWLLGAPVTFGWWLPDNPILRGAFDVLVCVVVAYVVMFLIWLAVAPIHFRLKSGNGIIAVLKQMWPQYLMVICGVGFFVGLIGFLQLNVTAPPKPPLEVAEFLYFDADIVDDSILAGPIRLNIRNTSSGPYMNVVAWFSPASAKGNPDPPGGPYWSLAPLKYVNPVQQAGGYWAGREVPLGYYRIEIIGNKGEKSVSFVELLELRELHGKIVQLVDVWGGSTKLYTSPRPTELQNNRTPSEP